MSDNARKPYSESHLIKGQKTIYGDTTKQDEPPQTEDKSDKRPYTAGKADIK